MTLILQFRIPAFALVCFVCSLPELFFFPPFSHLCLGQYEGEGLTKATRKAKFSPV